MDYTEEQLHDIETKRAAAVKSAEAAATVVAAKEATERTRAAMIAEIGGDPKEAAAALKAAQTAEADALSDVQKAVAAASASEARAVAAETTSAKLLQNAAISQALIEAGADAKAAATMSPSVIVPAGADASVITAAVETLKASIPQLFTPIALVELNADGTAKMPQTPKVDSHPVTAHQHVGQTKLSEGAAMFLAANPQPAASVA
jgi:hypothetical protein